jgi:hypothetical protein
MIRFAQRGTLITSLIIASIAAGCDSSPTRPSDVSATDQVSTPISAVAPAVALTVTSVTPSSGSLAGGTWGVIAGTGFATNAVVRFGDERVAQTLVESSSLIRFWTTAHAAGVVDVVVLNSGTQSARLPGAYSYAAPGSFDFNGDWIAHAGSDFAIDMRFTIRNNLLVSLSCAGMSVPFASGASISGGGFSSSGSEGVVTGRLVSPTTASGTIEIAPCASTWWADKSGTAPLRAQPHGQ